MTKSVNCQSSILEKIVRSNLLDFISGTFLFDRLIFLHFLAVNILTREEKFHFIKFKFLVR